MSSLGDVLLTTPLLRSLKKQNPEIQIDFIVKKQFADALRFNPHVSNLFEYDSTQEKNNFGLPDFSNTKYDLVIDLQNNLRSLKIRRQVNAPLVKFHKPNLAKFLLVNFKINLLKEKTPITARYSNSIEGLELDEKGLELHTNNQPDIRLQNGTNYVGFCPGAKHFTKQWLKEYFVELGNLLTKENYTVLLFGGKDDRKLCKEISNEINSSIDLSNDDELLQTAADMKICKMIVCNDSGLMHTACAVGIPVTVIFGSTVQEFGFAPYNTPNLILENKSLFCRPCSHIGRESCPKEHFKCMKEIVPQQALREILQFIKSK
ncbi:MAG: glycosyltransferase family 9 protein [Ignavibacteriales bacterium]|nr:MAG: glycosyltransferase family 9 protein [Ignavibacteriales bacterium]